jgi:hypothetical protein
VGAHPPDNQEEQEGNTIMRPLLIAAAVTAAGLTVVGLAGTADAAESKGWITHPATSYNAPSTKAQPVATFTRGTPVETLCSIRGENLDGNSTWFRIAEDGEQRGFVPRDAIGGVPLDLPTCTTGS